MNGYILLNYQQFLKDRKPLMLRNAHDMNTSKLLFQFCFLLFCDPRFRKNGFMQEETLKTRIKLAIFAYFFQKLCATCDFIPLLIFSLNIGDNVALV